MNNKTSTDILADKGYGDVIVFSNPSYDTCLIGITSDNNAVYDYELMIKWLMEHENMDYEEATDFICYNDSFYYGKGYPKIYYGKEYEEIMQEEDPEYKPLIFIRLEDLPNKN